MFYCVVADIALCNSYACMLLCMIYMYKHIEYQHVYDTLLLSADLCETFSFEVLNGYVHSRRWNSDVPVFNCAKLTIASFIVMNCEKQQSSKTSCDLPCLVCYTATAGVAVHQCSACSFSMCIKCEDGWRGRCPQCGQSLFNVLVLDFLQQQRKVLEERRRSEPQQTFVLVRLCFGCSALLFCLVKLYSSI